MRFAALATVLTIGCGKKEEPAPKPTPAPSASVVAKAEEKPSAATAFKGAYTAKQGAVRTPEDAPPFVHPDSKDGLGAGELELTVPAAKGEVVGKASGALGAQLFSGWLEDGQLRGTLQPSQPSDTAANAANAMWGVVVATVEGASIKGTIRVSGRDGRVVREATFTLEKKS